MRWRMIVKHQDFKCFFQSFRFSFCLCSVILSVLLTVQVSAPNRFQQSTRETANCDKPCDLVPAPQLQKVNKVTQYSSYSIRTSRFNEPLGSGAANIPALATAGNGAFLGRCARVLHISAKKGLPLPLGRGVCETNPKMGAPDPENPLFLGFSVLRGGLRPWSRKGPDHGVGVDPV